MLPPARALHPTANRLMRVYYRYPAADDSADRLNDVLLLIGEIEALEVASAVTKEATD